MKKTAAGKRIGNIIVTKGDAAQLRRMRCPACQAQAVVMKDDNGEPINFCPTCKRKFKSTRI